MGILRNGKEISFHSWVGYFVSSFFFEIRRYVNILTDFKGENRSKRNSQECIVIFLPFLNRKTKIKNEKEGLSGC